MASDPQGQQQFWFNGLPFEGVLLGSNDAGTQKFWFNGLPEESLIPGAGGTTTSTTSSSSTTTTSSSTTTTSSSSSTSTSTTLAPDTGGLAFGEENPTEGEIPTSWQTWSDGVGGIPDVTGDADWGKLHLDLDEQGRSKVYDFGNSDDRGITITENRYEAGSGSATIQIRGHDTVFLQDDIAPVWENYTVTVNKTWRFIQVRTTNP